jgi:hypothetical protein
VFETLDLDLDFLTVGIDVTDSNIWPNLRDIEPGLYRGLIHMHNCSQEIFLFEIFVRQFRRGTTTISLSPFPIKVETFLRMNGIKYVNDFDYPYSQVSNNQSSIN